jgi:hypothetical protein
MEDGPLPARLMAPWLDDNALFQNELALRNARLKDISSFRAQIENQIRTSEPANPCELGAVDAASVPVSFGDQLSILLQTVSIAHDGTPTIGKPERITGIDGHELRLIETPMRVAAECRELAKATKPTIADTSYWSFLMEVNQAITRQANISNQTLTDAVKCLVDDGAFLGMIQNHFVIPMTKTSESETYLKGVSDRQVLGQVLNPGEYIMPRPLVTGTSGNFGIERRRFKTSERDLLEDFYKRCLGVTFYKPHAWTRAYRIEGHLIYLEDPDWLMPLLAAVKMHTATNQHIVEPFPQFMADYTAKKLAAVGRLYGELNWHRFPEANYLKARTRRI